MLWAPHGLRIGGVETHGFLGVICKRLLVFPRKLNFFEPRGHYWPQGIFFCHERSYFLVSFSSFFSSRDTRSDRMASWDGRWAHIP